METTTGGRVDWRRGFAFGNGVDAGALLFRIGDGDGLKQGLGYRECLGCSNTSAAGPVSHDAAQVHNGNALRNMPHNTQVVADEDHGHARFLLQRRKQVDDLLPAPTRPARTLVHLPPATEVATPVRGQWQCAVAVRRRIRGDTCAQNAAPGLLCLMSS